MDLVGGGIETKSIHHNLKSLPLNQLLLLTSFFLLPRRDNQVLSFSGFVNSSHIITAQDDTTLLYLVVWTGFWRGKMLFFF